MKSNDLLSLLSRFESTLSDFSFEELGSEEASRLKNSFQNFKKDLQNRVYGEKSSNGQPPEEDSQNDHPSKTGSEESNLIANVSHEIRTPLNGIIGFADLLKESRLDKGQLINVNAIQSASYSLLEIVNELLEYSKLASGKEQFQRIEFNLFGLVRDVIFLCNTLITNKKVTLTSNITQDIPEFLIGDPSKLTQVLLNVMGNAIKFVNEGEVCLNITQSETSEANLLLEFEVKDDGIGIAKDKIDQIFDPFKQADADTASKYGGTGLGLSIVKQIVENLGGSINIKSNLGIGTTFKFTMPFEKGNQNQKTTGTSERKDSPQDLKSVVGLNILVFEDNILNQRLIEQRLKVWKCHIHITDDPEFGMEALENNDIDLVLMDLRMPIMSGFEITKLIRNSDSRRIREIPIIALTADYTIQDKEKCNSFGINDYLLKPFSPEELLSKLVAYQNYHERPVQSSESAKRAKVKSSDTSELVNLIGLFNDSSEDVVVLEDLVLLFKKNVDEFIANAEIQLNEEDVEGLAFSSHKIKAGLVMTRANSLLKTILEIQNGCNEFPDWKHLEFLYVRFVNDYPKVERAIDKALKDLKEN